MKWDPSSSTPCIVYRTAHSYDLTPPDKTYVGVGRLPETTTQAISKQSFDMEENSTRQYASFLFHISVGIRYLVVNLKVKS